jgi:hypothetical protein
VTNSGSEPVKLTGVALGGTDPGDFEILVDGATDCVSGTTLQAGEACKIHTRFDPASTGDKSASVAVSSDVLPDLTVALSGTGIQTSLSRRPTALDFGSRQVGGGLTKVKRSTITNTGTEALTLSKLIITDTRAARYLLVRGGGRDCAAGTTLPAGGTCNVRAFFLPLSVGVHTAIVTFTSSLGKATIVLTGRATPGPRLVMSGPVGGVASRPTKTLRMRVAASRGAVRGVVVSIRTAGGEVLDSLALGEVSRARTVTLPLKKALAAGRYIASARGRDAFRNVVETSLRFRLR